jgi:hypothetical protein
MNQNPDISRQLTLWNQRGSKVIRGRFAATDQKPKPENWPLPYADSLPQ